MRGDFTLLTVDDKAVRRVKTGHRAIPLAKQFTVVSAVYQPDMFKNRGTLFGPVYVTNEHIVLFPLMQRCR